MYLCTLKDCNSYKYQVICTRVPFSNKLFKEIVTDRIIYPYNPGKGLMYGHSYEVPVEEVETWLQSMTKENILHYSETIRIIEEENLQHYAEMKKKVQKENLESKSIGKSIKKTLKQIKQR